MNKNGMGAGSALIVLVFAVLCLAIFTLITYTQAQNDMALVQAEKDLVTSYYAADALAEQVAAHLVFAGANATNYNDIEITSEWDDSIGADVASFACPVTDAMELYVEVAVHEHDFDVLSWRMRSTGTWTADDSIQVWPGMETDDGMNLSTDGGASLWGGQ